jgi:hypothetical protein
MAGVVRRLITAILAVGKTLDSVKRIGLSQKAIRPMDQLNLASRLHPINRPRLMENNHLKLANRRHLANPLHLMQDDNLHPAIHPHLINHLRLGHLIHHHPVNRHHLVI